MMSRRQRFEAELRKYEQLTPEEKKREIQEIHRETEKWLKQMKKTKTTHQNNGTLTQHTTHPRVFPMDKKAARIPQYPGNRETVPN